VTAPPLEEGETGGVLADEGPGVGLADLEDAGDVAGVAQADEEHG